MGSLCGSGDDDNTTTTVTTSNLPAWMEREGENLYRRAAQVGNREYQPYQGPRVAGFSPDQQRGFDLMRSNVGSFQPYMDEAADFARQGGRQWNEAEAERYMNPFAQNVTDIAAREMDRRFATGQRDRNARAVSAGAFGGSRHGIVDAEAGRSHAQNLSDTYLKGGSMAYQSALGAFDADRRAAMGASNAMGGLGISRQRLGQLDAQGMLGTGRMQQGQEQRHLDTAFSDFLRQQNYDQEQINFMLGALTGTPYSQSSTSTTQQPGNNPLGQALGAILAGAGAGNQFGWWGS